MIVSQNGADQNQPQESSNGIDKFLIANTSVTVWLIFLGIGGGLLARYYLRIHYLPEMEWNAALVYLFVGSVWGGVIGLMLTMSLYLPGVIWCDIMIFETLLDNQLSYYADHHDRLGKRSIRKEPCIKSIMIWLGIPFFLALLDSHLLLRISNMSKDSRIDFYWVFALLLVVLVFFAMRGIFLFLLKPNKDTAEGRITNRQIFKYCTWFAISVLLNQISMYVIYRLADRTPGRSAFLVLTVLCTFLVWGSTHVVAVRHLYYPRQALVAALMTAVVLLAVADQFSDLSMKLMSRYGIGEDKKFNLLVKPDLVPLLKSERVRTCGQQHVCNVEILSKIGDHYFVRVDREVDTTVVRSEMTLPKSDVIAIRRLSSPIDQPAQ